MGGEGRTHDRKLKKKDRKKKKGPDFRWQKETNGGNCHTGIA